jgi:hypothetical protein
MPLKRLNPIKPTLPTLDHQVRPLSGIENRPYLYQPCSIRVIHEKNIVIIIFDIIPAE